MDVRSTNTQFTTAVILQLRNYGDSHRIVECLTRDFGRVACLARNARASRRRFGGGLDQFAQVQACLKPKRTGLWSLESIDLLDMRIGLRQSLERLDRANILCESLVSLLPEHEPVPAVFAICVQALDDLVVGNIAKAFNFHPLLYEILGIAPTMNRCVQCASEPSLWFCLDFDLGGMVCDGCAQSRGSYRFSRTVISAWQGKSTVERDLREAENVAKAWVEFHLGKGLRAGIARLT